MGFTLTHAITEPYKLLNIKLHTRKLLASVCELKYLAVWHEPEKLRRYGMGLTDAGIFSSLVPSLNQIEKGASDKRKLVLLRVTSNPVNV